MPDDRVNRAMKNLRHFLLKATRKTSPVCQQMELSLPGSRLTRDETHLARPFARFANRRSDLA
jgi:hypothetical protein